MTIADKILCVCIIGISLGPCSGSCIGRTVNLTITILTEPLAEFIYLFLGIAHVHGSSLVGCQLRFYTFQTAECSNGHQFTVCGRELVTSEDVAKEV